MVQIKHYMDIQALIENETELKQSNAKAFVFGDQIQISEKWDGANASVAYDPETGSLVAFSRKQPLTFDNTLRGFWNFVQRLDPKPFAKHPDWVVFGEWGIHNKILYDSSNYEKWYVYDIFNRETGAWLDQETVKAFTEEAGLIYIHVLYEGPFLSWAHCRMFLNSPAYGERQEGIVVKNLSKLNDPNVRQPFYLKIVNEDFKEVKKVKLPPDPAALAAKEKAQALTESVVTSARVEKMLFKLRNNGEIPDKLQPSDMGRIAKILPKLIYDDCVKEEPETVNAVDALEGVQFSKLCSSQTMQIARQLICN